MNLTTTQTVYVLLAAGLMLCWLMLVVLGPRRTEVANVLVVMRYGVVLRTFALVVALAPPLIMIYAIWAFPWRTSGMLNAAGIAFLATSIVGGLLLIEVTRVQILLTEEGLHRFSPWSGAVSLNWIEVERVGYSAANRWFTVEGAGRTVRVSRHLGDTRNFVEIVRRKVAAERCAGAAKVLDEVSGRRAPGER
jgi:hypothetical protein